MNNKNKLFIPRKQSGSDSKWVEWNKEQPIKNINGRDIRINQYDEDGLKQGYWERYWSNGMIRSKGRFKDGKPDGYWEYYWSNGNLWYKGSYKYDESDRVEFIEETTLTESKNKLFIPRKLSKGDNRYDEWNNSQPVKNINGKEIRINQCDEDGKKQGYWEEYYNSGNIETKGSYINGIKDGYWEYYYPNGIISSNGSYKGGKRYSIWQFYFDNGNIKSKFLYKNGKPIKRLPLTESKKLFIPRKQSGSDSKWVQWNKEQPVRDGVRINKYNIETGEKDGYWESYWDNGNIWSKGSYKGGERDGYWEWYWDNGNIWSKGSYKGGNREGYWEFYYLNRKIESKGEYKDDKRDGYWEEYDSNGNIISKKLYKDGILIKRLPLTESKNKLFIPRKQSGSDSKWVQWNKEQPVRDGVRINQYTEDGEKEGYWEEYYSNGNIYSNGRYKDGKPDGMWEWYYPNGDLHSKGNYKDGKKEGIWEEYYRENGNIESKGEYRDGEREGIREDYYPNGDIWCKGSYKNGEEEGYWEWYYDNGNIASKGSYKRGNKEGIWEFYYDNGNIESKGPYVDGEKDGIWEYYWTNGNLKSKGEYNNGELVKTLPLTESKNKLFIPRKQSGSDSKWVQWNKEQPVKDGVIINQYDEDGLKQGYWEEYYRDGNLASKGSYINGKMEGNWEYYFSDGKIESKGECKDGKPEGYWEIYWRNGKIHFKVEYKDGKQEGMLEDYNDDGSLSSKGSYKDGKADGYWEWYYDNGNITSKGEYKDGLKYGIWEEYYYNGNIESKGPYVDGEKDGIWEWYYSNGNLKSKGEYNNGELVKTLPLTESKNKLFIPRKQSGSDSKWAQWNREQPIKNINGKEIRINQYNIDTGKEEGYWEYYDEDGNIYSKGYYKDGKMNGYWEEYNSSGVIMYKGDYKNDKRDGYWELYHPNGNIYLKCNYKDGNGEGIWEYYYSNGNIMFKGEYKGGYREGIWEYYWNNGNLGSRKLYKDGKIVKELPLTESKTLKFLIKEEINLIKEGKIEDYINNTINKIKNLPYETKKKYLTIVISSLLGYTSYPVIQSIIDKSPDKETKEIVNKIVNKEKKSDFKDGTTLSLSKKGFNHIVNEEKPKLIAYNLGDGKITIGYGHAEPIETTKLKVGQKISLKQAQIYLKQDLKIAEAGVIRMFNEWKKQGKNYKVTQDMFDALVSMAFNMGVTGLRQTKMIQHLKNGNYKIAGQLIKRTNIDPDTFPGLEIRRKKESQMFLSYLNKLNDINA